MDSRLQWYRPLSPPTLNRQTTHYLHRFQADTHDLTDEPDDILLVVKAVGVGVDAAAFVGLEAVLVNDPLQGATVAETIGEYVGGNAGQGERVVDYQGGLVLAELHAVYAVRQRHVVRFDPLQVIRLKGFVIEMQLGKLFAGGSERLKVRGKRNAGKLTFQVVGELFPVAGMVKQAIDVIENVPFGYGIVTVMVAELLKPPVGDVLAPFAAVLIVDIEGEALSRVSIKIQVQGSG